MKVFLFQIGFFLLTFQLTAISQTTMSLKDCIEYAQKNSLSLQSDLVNVRLVELQLKQSKWNKIPSVGMNLSEGLSNGRSINPTTNQFVNASYYYTGLSANANVLLFGWFQNKHLINQNKYSLESTQFTHQQLQNDLSLNVATGYLRAILAQKQIDISLQQIDYSLQQKVRTQSLVDAGTTAELSLLQVQSQLSNDSSNYIQAVTRYAQAILQLKALLNMSFEEVLELQEPQVSIALDELTEFPTDADLVNSASENMYTIKAAEAQKRASYEAYKSADAGRYPSLSFGYNWGSNYASTQQELVGKPYLAGASPTAYFIGTDSSNYQPVYQLNYNYDTRTTPFFNQIGNNQRHTFTLNLNIPILSNYTLTGAAKRAKYNYEVQNLNYSSAKLKLTQDVLIAKTDAINALQVWKTSKTALINAEKSFEFATKRYDLGLMNLLEYQLEKNNLYKAQVQEVSNHYDLIFKKKVLDYYLGKEIW